MALSWNEIKDRALAFSREWAAESSEDAEAKSFWDGFFNVFGVPRRRVATFETPVKRGDASTGYIDLLWKGQILVEHKSRGKNLDKAFQQAKDYFPGLKDADLPKYILVSDFARFRLYDLERDIDAKEYAEFPLADLYKNVKLLGFMAGYLKRDIKPQDPVNIEAVERLGKLHDELAATGYSGHPLEILLVRLLFCLFAEDTSIFEKGIFREFIENKTREDGSDLGNQLSGLFFHLNQKEEERQKNLDEAIAVFPYVNGRLYEEFLPPAQFSAKMRDALLECTALDWSRISPAIFGSLFQSVMSGAKRREQGAHYTTEENILKLIGPLFLDDLKAELGKLKGKEKLEEFHQKLANLRFLDPACGCGNFLVIAYREIRALELQVLKKLYGGGDQPFLDAKNLVWCDVDQFYGIELDEFPARIAEVAMWLMDHQMNLAVSEAFGQYFRRLPLKKAATIAKGNALRIDWNSVVPAKKLNFILGNPPFVGHQWRNADQMQDMAMIWGEDGRFGRLDYVTCWYRKAAELMKMNPSLAAAFVSTNSISQGEQVGILWDELLSRGMKIQFAHRTFQWNSDARGKAAVHCVIIGFALETENPSPAPALRAGATSPRKRGEVMGDLTSPRLRGEVAERSDAGEGSRVFARKFIFDYETPKSEPHRLAVNNINPYLTGGPDIILPSRTESMPGIPQMKKGSQPTDGGYLILDDFEKSELLAREPAAKIWIMPYVGGDELISGKYRWCLWLKNATPADLSHLPVVKGILQKVKQARLGSPTKSVREFAEMPAHFTQDRQPSKPYLAVPEVSSEGRRYIPMAFLTPDYIASNKLQMIVGATIFHFGVMNSTMHMAWVRTVTGRMKSDLSYSPSVYNNYPWPENPSATAKATIEKAAQSVLDARAAHKGASLADLYDPLTMPPDLLKAHRALDTAVDAAYGRKSFATDAERVAFLFARYEQLIKAPLEKFAMKPTKRGKR